MRRPRQMNNERVVVIALGLGLITFLVYRQHTISTQSLLFLAVLFPSVILHEVSHGAVALIFGDDTAKRAGRLTLNPLSHVDPVGTVVLPLFLLIANAPIFGYAKPVPYNPARLRRPRDHSLLVALAGPFVNIILAVLAALILGHVAPPAAFTNAAAGGGPLLWRLIFLAGLANVYLAAFNLLPIPPLDGSAVLERLMPRSWWPGYLKFRQYSIFLLLLVLLAGQGLRNGYFNWASNLWVHLLPRSVL
jgi:Zn-dependent protease